MSATKRKRSDKKSPPAEMAEAEDVEVKLFDKDVDMAADTHDNQLSEVREELQEVT